VFGAGASRPSNKVEAVFEELWDRIRAAEMFVEVFLCPTLRKKHIPIWFEYLLIYCFRA